MYTSSLMKQILSSDNLNRACLLYTSNYIFDLYGTLVDIHTNEKKAYLWKKMSLFFGMKGAAYEPKELRMAYETKIKEQELSLIHISVF